jgi:serine/threonine protein kinase
MLDHPNIIKLEDTFQDSLSLYFLLEYAPSGNLSEYIKKKGKLSYELTRFYAAEIVNAIGKFLNRL